MNTITYTFSDTWLISRSSPFARAWVLRDARDRHPELERLFRQSLKQFRLRSRDLGNLDLPTTDNDAEAMRLVLDALIRAKAHIFKERGES